MSVLNIAYKMPVNVHENAGQNAYKYTYEKTTLRQYL